MASGEGGDDKKQRSRGRRRRLWAACLPRPGCFTVSAADEGPSAPGAGKGQSEPKPTHLVVTVNGIVGRCDLSAFPRFLPLFSYSVLSVLLLSLIDDELKLNS